VGRDADLEDVDAAEDDEEDGAGAARGAAERVSGASQADVAKALIGYARAHAKELELVDDPALKIALRGVHAAHRVAPDGRLLTELVAQFVQTERRLSAEGSAAYGGLLLRGGTTIVASDEGVIRYVIARPLPVDAPADDEARRARTRARRAELRAFVEESDLSDPRMPSAPPAYLSTRMTLRASLAALHRGVRP
jgi:hypothetical protein